MSSADFWNLVVEWYDTKGALLTTPIYHTFLYLLKLDRATKIFEAACGPANGIPLIQQYLSPTALITAGDFAEAFIEKALTKNYERVSFVVANNEELPFPDNEFDAYIANFCISEVPNPGKMLQEAIRVTKPGSVSAFTAWRSLEGRGYMSLLTDEVAEQTGTVAIKELYKFGDPELFKQTALDAGFSQVFTFEMATPTVFLDVESTLNSYAAVPEVAKLEQVNDIISSLRPKLLSLFASGTPPVAAFTVCLGIK